MPGNHKQAVKISSDEAWNILSKDSNAHLVDVRTDNEWNIVGYPDLSSLNKDLIKITWRYYPNMEINENFKSQLETYITDKNSTILFICKAGGRSQEAANFMLNMGYVNCLNINDGFEGNSQNSEENNGWKASNLPWEQN